MVTENKQMQVRRGTSSAWSSANPTPLAGEISLDSTLNKIKVGDGTTAWNTLGFISSGIIASRGIFASRPGSGTNVGDLYSCTDVGNEYRWNGTTWDLVRGGDLPWTPPPSSGWSALNSGSVSASLDSRVVSVATVSGTDSWKGEIRTLSPTSNYTATFYLDWAFPGLSFIRTGAVLRNSGSGSMICFGAAHDTSNGSFNLWCTKWTNATTFSAQYTLISQINLANSVPNWVRFRDDGTTRFYEYSFNGLDWILDTSTTRTDFITPDQIGWGINPNCSTAATATVRLRSFAIT